MRRRVPLLEVVSFLETQRGIDMALVGNARSLLIPITQCWEHRYLSHPIKAHAYIRCFDAFGNNFPFQEGTSATSVT